MVENMKRIISAFLVLCIITSFLMTGAFAAGEDYRGWVQSDSRWGSLPYASDMTVTKKHTYAVRNTNLRIRTVVIGYVSAETKLIPGKRQPETTAVNAVGK